MVAHDLHGQWQKNRGLFGHPIAVPIQPAPNIPSPPDCSLCHASSGSHLFTGISHAQALRYISIHLREISKQGKKRRFFWRSLIIAPDAKGCFKFCAVSPLNQAISEKFQGYSVIRRNVNTFQRPNKRRSGSQQKTTCIILPTSRFGTLPQSTANFRAQPRLPPLIWIHRAVSTHQAAARYAFPKRPIITLLLPSSIWLSTKSDHHCSISRRCSRYCARL